MKDIEASKVFYEKLGVTVFGGDQSRNWLVLKNGAHVIGLFQGMFEKDILVFKPPGGTKMASNSANSLIFESCSASSKSEALS